MPLQPSWIYSCPRKISQSAFFSCKTFCVDIFWWETACVSKAREWPRGWQMRGPRAVQNLQMPHPRDWQGGQMPRSIPGAGLCATGIDWCIKEPTLLDSTRTWRELQINVRAGRRDGFSSLSEKSRKSNRLQMSLKKHHCLLSYLNTLSVVRPGFELTLQRVCF